MDDAAAPGGGSKSRTAYTRAEIQALMASPSAEAQARLWAQVYAALAAAGFAGEYDGLLAVEESPNRRGNKGKKAAGGRGGRKGPEEAVAPRSLGTAPQSPFYSCPLERILSRFLIFLPGLVSLCVISCRCGGLWGVEEWGFGGSR